MVKRLVLIVLGLLSLALVAARLAAPALIQVAINRKLAGNPDYAGQVNGVTLSLVRGTIDLHDLQICQRAGHFTLTAGRVQAVVAWSSLIQGSWIPDAIVLEEGLLRLSSDREAGRDIPIHNLHVAVTNLANGQKLSDPLSASAQASAGFLRDGAMDVTLRFDPRASRAAFEVQSEMKNIDLPAVTSVFRLPSGLMISQGELSLSIQANAADGSYKGTVKPHIKNLDVQNVIGGYPVKIAVRNAAVETGIPFSGTFDHPGMPVWDAVALVLRKAVLSAVDHGQRGVR